MHGEKLPNRVLPAIGGRPHITSSPTKFTMKRPFHFLRAGLALAAALATGSITAQTTNTQTAATGADLAWRELQSALQPPPVPSEWQGKQPTAEQIDAYRTEQGRLAGVAADKAKAFITQYPDHAKLTEAKRQYARMLDTAVKLGNTARTKEYDALQAERLQDPNTPEQERFNIRAQTLMKELEAVKEESEQMVAYEKMARQLMKEFPKRPEPYQMLLSVAGNTDEARARVLFKELAGDGVPAEIQAQAKTLAERFERVGQPLDIKFKSTTDQEVDLQSLKGKVVLVDFWATWCGPCVKEIPNVKATYEKLHAKGFEIVGISFDSDRKKLDDFVAKEKMPWVQYFDGKGWGNELGKKFGINSIPAMWLVDKKGVLRELNARADLEKKVEKYLAEN
jgi:thiol-disulfide isomerase/thioredoxin